MFNREINFDILDHTIEIKVYQTSFQKEIKELRKLLKDINTDIQKHRLDIFEFHGHENFELIADELCSFFYKCTMVKELKLKSKIEDALQQRPDLGPKLRKKIISTYLEVKKEILAKREADLEKLVSDLEELTK